MKKIIFGMLSLSLSIALAGCATNQANALHTETSSIQVSTTQEEQESTTTSSTGKEEPSTSNTLTETDSDTLLNKMKNQETFAVVYGAKDSSLVDSYTNNLSTLSSEIAQQLFFLDASTMNTSQFVKELDINRVLENPDDTVFLFIKKGVPNAIFVNEEKSSTEISKLFA